jgi:integrase
MLVVPTFSEAAQKVHAEHAKAWRNTKHEDQWINTLSKYAYPVIGSRRVDQVDAADVLKILGPLWLKRPETARRVRQRLKTVFDWAKIAGFRTEGNPVEAVEKALPRQPERRGHFAALRYDQVPAFFRNLASAEAGEGAKLAFEFLILTATRTNEVLGAHWNEFNTQESIWTIPAERTKARREHRVPLCPRVLEILKKAREIGCGADLIFPGRIDGKPMSNMVFLMILRRMSLKVTAHGFRSTFRDWAAEKTNFPREVCEAALAHAVKDKTEGAYRRGDLFDKRSKLMEAWAGFAARTGGKVVQFRAAKSA